MIRLFINIPKHFTIWRLRNHGKDKIRRYALAVESLMDALDFKHAETICPLLVHYRRRAKACAKLANKIKKTIYS